MSYKQSIISVFIEVFKEEDVSTPAEFTDDLVLLDCGLDSLGLAVLVTKLSDKLGFDPFVESPDPFYPITLGEFVLFYDNRRA